MNYDECYLFPMTASWPSPGSAPIKLLEIAANLQSIATAGLVISAIAIKIHFLSSNCNFFAIVHVVIAIIS